MVTASTRLRLRVSPGRDQARSGRPPRRRLEGPRRRGPGAGRANDAVLALLARTLGVPRASLTLVSGHGARDKVVELDGIEPDEVERRLTAAGEGG